MFRMHSSRNYQSKKPQQHRSVTRSKTEHVSKPRKIKPTYFTPSQSSFAIIFLLLIVGASITEVSANINLLKAAGPKDAASDNKNSTQLIKSKIKSNCVAHTLVPTNKHPDVRIDMYNGIYIPVTCIEDYKKRATPTPECTLDVRKQSEWRERHEKHSLKILMHAMGETREKNHNETVTFAKQAEKFRWTLTKSQQAKYEKIIIKLAQLRLIADAHDYTSRVKIGDCVHQSYHTAFNLLALQENFKIQMVHAWETTGADHYFILIDSNVDDIRIDNNLTAARAYLKNLTQGEVCDKWNRGYFEEAATKQLGLYSTYWESLEVTTLDLNFDYQGLPEPVIQSIKEELQVIKLSATPEAAHNAFFNRPNTSAVAEEKPAYAPKLEL